MDPHLEAFLHGTVTPPSPLYILRGNSDLLRQIWILVCEEWWDLHIDKTFEIVSHKYWKGGVCDLRTGAHYGGDKIKTQGDHDSKESKEQSSGTSHGWIEQIADSELSGSMFGLTQYPRQRLRSGGCPFAVINSDVRFPPKSQVPAGTFVNQESNHLHVNMMPIVLGDVNSVPEICRGYWPLIQSCTRLLVSRRMGGSNRVVYLTIDERPVAAGQFQRRRGLHVESPGVLPVLQEQQNERKVISTQESWGEEADKAEARMCSHHSRISGGMFVPAAEHHWGRGIFLMMREERVDGGIFMTSNVSGTCAVWNSRVWDRGGKVIGPHGDVERLRPLLGAPAKILDAGEMVWMTDKTPHESLPLPHGVPGRQFFRMVVGDITAWFADHSTPNPISGITPPSSVRIVNGNKFHLYSSSALCSCRRWCCGTPATLRKAHEETELRELAMRFGLGHLVERMILYGISSIRRLLELSERYRDSDRKTFWDEKHSSDGQRLFLHRCSRFYDVPRFKEMVKAVRANHSLVEQHSRYILMPNTQNSKKYFSVFLNQVLNLDSRAQKKIISRFTSLVMANVKPIDGNNDKYC